MHPFEQSVLRGCRRLIEPGARVLVACSGGPDSSALVVALSALRERLGLAWLGVAHLDHGIRGDEARRDAEAAAALAARLGLPCRLGAADAPAELVARGGGSLEAAARAVRYRFLAEVARALDADRVALGHTADDQAETVLLRLLRGAGLPGLAGMPRRRRLPGCEARLVRPLLGQRRAALLEYLAERGVEWVEDRTNRDLRFLRARLRHEVLPLLRASANPASDEALLRLAAQARRARRHLDREARALLGEAASSEGWSCAALLRADPAVRAAALHRIARTGAPDRVGAAHVDALLKLVRRGRGQAALPGGACWSVVDGQLLPPGTLAAAAPAPEAADSIPLPAPGQALDPTAGLVFTARVAPWSAELPLPLDPARAVALDADRVQGDLALRRRRSGDRFWPLGAPGGRSLKRFFNDRKVPREERASVPVVTLDDRPLWIVGHRIDERYKVTPVTRRVLHIEARRVPRGEGCGS